MQQSQSQRLLNTSLTLAPILVSLVLTAALILLTGNDPLEVLRVIWAGSMGGTQPLAGVFNFGLPLVLVSIGLVVTFRAGLWNIGVEGQIMAGAVGASAVALLPPHLPAPIAVGLALLAGVVSGMAWGALIALLKLRAGVHEIFGGTALNALANLLSIYLITGPWLPAEGGSAQGTSPFPAVMKLEPFSREFAVSPVMLGLVIVSVISVLLVLTYTRWGLELKATGKNLRSALLLGVPVERSLLTALMVCGALAGLAGAYRVLFIYNNLRPLVSGGIGFLGLLVVLLAGMRDLWVPLIAFVFAAILSGTTRLKIELQLDQSLAGILQGTLVLVSLFFQGIKERVLSGEGRVESEK